MKWTIQRQVLAGFLFAILLLSLSAYILFTNIVKFSKDAETRGQSYKTIILIEQFISQIKDIENNQQGYIIVANNFYLHPFDSNLINVYSSFDELKAMTRDKPTQQERLDRIKILLDKKIAQIKKTIKLIQLNNQAGALDYIRYNKETNLMEQIKLLGNEMKAEENHRLLHLNDQVKKGSRRTLIISMSETFLAFIILATVYFALNKEISQRKNINERLEKEIEERKKAQEKIEILNQDLNQQVINLNSVNKELESFSYSVSHDLRAPLRSIDGFSQALLDKHSAQLDEKGQDYLRRVRLNSQRMAQLIDDMIQLSRLTRGVMKVEELNLSSLAKEIADDLKEEDKDRIVEFKIKENLEAKGDKHLLQVVLRNLLGNAWKFTSKHSSALIEFGQGEFNGNKAFFVKDDGAGFDMEYVHKLFGAFQRIHGMTEFPGTGIGLATVQRIIHRHGGQIWAEGEIEKGAIFYFTLP